MHMCTICIASSKIQSVQRLFPLQKCAALFLNCHFIDIKDSQKYVTYKCYKTVYSWDGYIFFKFVKLLKWSCDYCGEVVTIVVKWWRLWWGGDGCGEVVIIVLVVQPCSEIFNVMVPFLCKKKLFPDYIQAWSSNVDRK